MAKYEPDTHTLLLFLECSTEINMEKVTGAFCIEDYGRALFKLYLHNWIYRILNPDQELFLWESSAQTGLLFPFSHFHIWLELIPPPQGFIKAFQNSNLMWNLFPRHEIRIWFFSHFYLQKSPLFLHQLNQATIDVNNRCSLKKKHPQTVYQSVPLCRRHSVATLCQQLMWNSTVAAPLI